MRRLLAPIALLVLLVCGSAASAVTLAGRFTELDAEVAARLAALPDSGLSKAQKKEKSTLGQVAATLAKDTEELAKTLKNAKKAVSKLDKAYPGDATFAPLLDAVVAGLTSDVAQRGGDLFISIQLLPDGTAKTKAQAASDAAEAEIVAAAAELVRATRLSRASKALKLIVKGERIVTKAGGGTVVTNELDVDIGDVHMHLPPATGDYIFMVNYDPGMDVLQLTARQTIDETIYLFSLRVSAPAIGTQSLLAGPPTAFSSSAITGQPPFQLQPGGTMTFTVFDPDNSRFVGTFSATFSNGTTTVTLTNGSFTKVN
jgi:hypothetical protein